MKDETQRSTVESRSSWLHPYVCVCATSVHNEFITTSTSRRLRVLRTLQPDNCRQPSCRANKNSASRESVAVSSFACPSCCWWGFHTHTQTKVRCRVHSGRGADNVQYAKSRWRCCCCLLTRCTAFRTLAIGGAHTNGNSRVRRKK